MLKKLTVEDLVDFVSIYIVMNFSCLQLFIECYVISVKISHVIFSKHFLWFLWSVGDYPPSIRDEEGVNSYSGE